MKYCHLLLLLSLPALAQSYDRTGMQFVYSSGPTISDDQASLTYGWKASFLGVGMHRSWGLGQDGKQLLRGRLELLNSWDKPNSATQSLLIGGLHLDYTYFPSGEATGAYLLAGGGYLWTITHMRSTTSELHGFPTTNWLMEAETKANGQVRPTVGIGFQFEGGTGLELRYMPLTVRDEATGRYLPGSGSPTMYRSSQVQVNQLQFAVCTKF